MGQGNIELRTLEEIFKHNTGLKIHRHDHVLKLYSEFFERYRGKDVKVLEIGIGHGGSLYMWKEYFGSNAKIYGIDISSCKIKDEQIKVFMADQSDICDLEDIVDETGDFDIIIDDGSHVSEDQISSFEFLIDHLNDNGLYCIEDIHTSYRNTYGGGYKYEGSIVEYTKNFVDYFHDKEMEIETPRFIKKVYGIHYYRNVLVIEKHSGAHLASSPLLTGEGTIKDDHHKITGTRF